MWAASDDVMATSSGVISARAPDFKFTTESLLFQSRVPEVQRRGCLPGREALNKDAIVGNVGS